MPGSSSSTSTLQFRPDKLLVPGCRWSRGVYAPLLGRRHPCRHARHALARGSAGATPRPPLSPPARSMRRSRDAAPPRSEEHTSELQSLAYLVCRLLLEKKKKKFSRWLAGKKLKYIQK